MLVVPEGWGVEFNNPPPSDGNYGLYRREQISAAAAGVGLSYEHVTLNFEKVNDRQYRALMLQSGRMIEAVQDHMIEPICREVWRRFVSSAILAGVWTPPPGAREKDYMEVDWMPPPRGHIHPVQDFEAVAKAIEAGLMSRKRGAAIVGNSVETIDLENARDKSRASKMGLTYSVYPETMTAPAVVSPADNSDAEARIDGIVEQDVDELLDRVEQAETA